MEGKKGKWGKEGKRQHVRVLGGSECDLKKGSQSPAFGRKL
jgi:hypothetical protein